MYGTSPLSKNTGLVIRPNLHRNSKRWVGWGRNRERDRISTKKSASKPLRQREIASPPITNSVGIDLKELGVRCQNV